MRMTENKPFSVEKLEMVSDHLSTRFFIVNNESDEAYDVQHIVSVGFEIQYESWADKICDKWNELAEENEQLKKEIHELNQRNNQVLAYNSACEDTLLNVDVVLHRLIDKYCSNNNEDAVSICDVLQEFKKEIFPSSIQPEIKPILGPVGRCIPNPFEIKKEKPEKVLKKAIEGYNEL